MRLRVSLLAAALLCGAAVLLPAAAWAAGGDASFALKPLKYDPALPATKSYFILDAKPGDVIHDQIRVVNTGGKTGTAYLYPVDATTGQTSGAVYLSRQSPRHDVGAWVRLSTSRVTLAPGKNAVVDFTIRVPRSVRPGDHLGGIVAENSQIQQSSGKGALQIKIKHLTIDAVEVQLPGPAVGLVQAISVKPGGQHGYQYVYVHLKSSGTVMIKPSASLTIRRATGAVVATRTVQLDTFVPGSAIDYPVLLPKQALSPGRYTASVRLRSTSSPVVGYRKTALAPFDVTRTFTFTVTSGEKRQVFSGVAPVTPAAQATSHRSSSSNKLLAVLVAILAVLVLGVLGVLFVLLRRGRRAKAAPAVPPVPAPAAPAAAPLPEATPVESAEEPGWAGLLAAYESGPRPREGWHEHDRPEGSVAVTPPEPEPVVQAVVVPSPEPGYEFEPVVDYAPVGEYEPTPVPDEAPLPEYEPVFEPSTEPELEPATIPAFATTQSVPVLDPDTIGELIVRHDLAVADAYFQALPDESVPADPDPEPEHARQPAPEPVRHEVGAVNLSSALLDASLVALAAVLATRLLKTDG